MKNNIEEESDQQQELYVQIRDDIADQIIKHGLSKTESKLFFYLLKLDRFGDRPAKVKVTEILLATGIGKTAYHAAISKFESMGWFDFKHSEVEITNFCTPAKKSAKSNFQSEIPNSRFGNASKKFGKANSKFIKTNQKSEITENRPPEPAHCKASKTPQTVQTSSDFNQTNQTLSQATRERNLILWKKLEPKEQAEIRRYAYAFAIPKLPIKPTLPDCWISHHCIELFNQLMVDVDFQKAEASRNSLIVENQAKHSPSASIMGQCKSQCSPVEEEEICW